MSAIVRSLALRLSAMIGVALVTRAAPAHAQGAGDAQADSAARRAATEHMASLLRIRTPHGVQSLEQVTLGGVKQWISIRGSDRANPVMLFIHGGPGDGMIAREWAFQRPWEDYFTVVQWDQRGGGKNGLADTSAALLSTLSTARDIADAEELIPILTKRFGVHRIVLVGHSFGTIIGAQLAARHPDWFSVYVGIGQAAPNGEAMLYHDALALAHAARDTAAVRQLESIAPYPNVPADSLLRDVMLLRRWSRAFGGAWYGDTGWDTYEDVQWLGPEYTDAELNAFDAAEGRVTSRVLQTDFFDAPAKLPRCLSVPVVFMMGRHDLHTPYSAARAYFDSLSAPSKAFVTFENSAHVPFLEEPGRFFAALLQYVLPLSEREAVASGTTAGVGSPLAIRPTAPGGMARCSPRDR
jgi:pimeloyl-ACP methyl ester carboxylesterase